MWKRYETKYINAFQGKRRYLKTVNRRENMKNGNAREKCKKKIQHKILRRRRRKKTRQNFSNKCEGQGKKNPFQKNREIDKKSTFKKMKICGNKRHEGGRTQNILRRGTKQKVRKNRKLYSYPCVCLASQCITLLDSYGRRGRVKTGRMEAGREALL